jgi:hypothetical protein
MRNVAAIIAIPCCDYYPRLLLPGLPPDLDYQDEACFIDGP